MGDSQYRDLEDSDEEVDMEDLLEYMSDEEDFGDHIPGFHKPQLKVDFSTAVVVDNLPQVNREKLDKLAKVTRKVFSQIGTISEDNGLVMPFDEEKDLSRGFAFVNYSTPEEAKQAVISLNDWQLDKAHLLRVFPYEQLERLAHVPETYQEPTPQEFKPRVDPSSWLADEQHRDQFVVRYSLPGPTGTDAQHHTEVMWCEKNQAPTLCYGGDREKQSGKSWCELYVMWSPQGTYLCTFHSPGIALWGGNSFEKHGRFAHRQVKVVEFSPCENYIMTSNFDGSDQAIIIWEILTGTQLRNFPMATYEGGPPSLFKWSWDGKYIARKGKDLISIYELPSMKLLDKKSLKADGLEDFEWSPKDNILAYWSPEADNAPARVSVVEIPSRKELRQKNLFNVRECRLHWQQQGDYLCVKVLRHSKSKKTMFNNFELFRVREDLVPVEMMEIKENVIAFAWEPSGDRFAVVHGDAPKLSTTFYTMKGGQNEKELQELETLADRVANHLYWSPMGGYILLAAMGDGATAGNGYLEFYDVDSSTSLKQGEHFRCSHIEWDPSGRYVTTAVTQSVDGGNWKAQMDNGYRLWSFQGQAFHEMTKDSFYQVLWRPRPASLLSHEDKKKVIKNLKKYERQFEKADKEKEKRRQRDRMADKIRLKMDFRERLWHMRERVAERHGELVELQGGYDSEDEGYYIIDSQTREVVLSVKEEVLSQ